MRNSETRPPEKLRLHRVRQRLRKIRMKCLCSGEQMRLIEEEDKRSELGVGNVSSALSAAESENAKKLDNGNIEEAELSLRETSSLNYEVRFPSSPTPSRIKKKDVSLCCCFRRRGHFWEESSIRKGT